MKRLAQVRRWLIVVGVFAVGLAGFGVGRVSVPERHAVPNGIVSEPTPAPLEVAAPPEYSPLPPTPGQVSPSAQPQKPATGGAYVLKRDGDGLVVLRNEVVVTAFSAEWRQLPEPVKLQLETGILFDSLADIESYLEDYES